MTFRNIISHIRKSPEDAWYYIQGNLRLMAYRSKFFKFFLRKHIIEQYEWRRDIAAKPCYFNGSCLCCGCDTPELFFASKSCNIGKPKYKHCDSLKKDRCYEIFLGRRAWNKFKE